MSTIKAAAAHRAPEAVHTTPYEPKTSRASPAEEVMRAAPTCRATGPEPVSAEADFQLQVELRPELLGTVDTAVIPTPYRPTSLFRDGTLPAELRAAPGC